MIQYSYRLGSNFTNLSLWPSILNTPHRYFWLDVGGVPELIVISDVVYRGLPYRNWIWVAKMKARNIMTENMKKQTL